MDSSAAPVRRKGLAAQVEELRDAHGRARGWRVQLDNGTVAELEAEPAEGAPPRLH